ncbi:hypothetical protein [Aureivirga sp. CE67]|uniref:hypothetical protein n=1 Tax=Aureivirga sp. CE67 TaxID=1788983 RepID=UPI0018C9782D|nr:hypothetical protein [Aureivirga sp. CE67]
MIIKIFTLSLLIILSNCNAVTKEKESEKVEITQESEIGTNSDSIKIEPRIIYVAYGYYCGECANECTKMYKHYLIGNMTTFWTDKTDSYFKDGGLKFETKMSRESEKISFELINKIPKSILASDRNRNIYGCPDCDDGCGLYFEFQLDVPNSKPIKYGMEYSFNGATGDIKEFG